MSRRWNLRQLVIDPQIVLDCCVDQRPIIELSITTTGITTTGVLYMASLYLRYCLIKISLANLCDG